MRFDSLKPSSTAPPKRPRPKAKDIFLNALANIRYHRCADAW
ncbi:MAG: hypothetical protein WKG07_06545 [Hymenobacter sp.]